MSIHPLQLGGFGWSGGHWLIGAAVVGSEVVEFALAPLVCKGWFDSRIRNSLFSDINRGQWWQWLTTRRCYAVEIIISEETFILFVLFLAYKKAGLVFGWWDSCDVHPERFDIAPNALLITGMICYALFCRWINPAVDMISICLRRPYIRDLI